MNVTISPSANPQGSQQRMVRVHYRNWRGEERTREIRPIQVQWGTSDWHPEDQWMLLAVDPEDGKTKLFALKDCDFLHPNDGRLERLRKEDVR